MTVGKEAFLFDNGPWSILGGDALIEEGYIPDFSACVSTEKLRCLEIEQSVFNFVTRSYDPKNLGVIQDFFNKNKNNKIPMPPPPGQTPEQSPGLMDRIQC